MTAGGAPPFAEPDDLGRPLTGPEREIAEQLLAAAASWIRSRLPDIAVDDPNARTVSIDVVSTAMATRAYAGHISYTRTTGPRTKSGTLTNPGGALVFDDWHKELLGISIHPAPVYYFGDKR
ncbi:hypothetical protein [Nocardia sp. CA-290969]|uniref:hypothetical protein n=1 Tax=Nocardia sp. CA-290969 TaxID=3239986 RepID=UPI003D9036E6